MPNYTRKPYKFICRGLGLRYPPDLLPDGFYPVLNNMTARVLGGVQSRSGISLLNTLVYPDPIHSIRRLNDPTNSSFARIIGAGANVYDSTSVTAIDTGYSGSPLSMVPFRPDQSPRPWMYISDATRSRKIRTDRTNYAQGIAPPMSAPSIARGVPNYAVAEQFNAAGTWTNTGTAGAISTPNRFNTTVSAILYDAGATGWACLKPTAIDSNCQSGALIILDAAGVNEVAKIRQVFEAVTDTTIASIMYDSGATGLCSIVLTAQSTGLQPDAMVRIAAAEYVRVLSVTTGVDGQVSFRCSTTGARAAGNAIAGAASLRIYTVNPIAAGQTLTGNVFQSTIASGNGWLSIDKSAGPVNLAVINNRPVQLEDYLHISFQVDDPSRLTQLRIIINTDTTFPSDFTKLRNAYYKDVSASVFQPVVNSALTAFAAQQSAIQRSFVEQEAQGRNMLPNELFPLDIDSGEPTGGIATDPVSTPIADQTVPGNSAWTELNIKISELSRVGSDQTRSLATVTGFAIQAQVTNSMVLLVSSLWIGGTYGPDSKGSIPYLFYQRYRSSASGAKSNPSPIMRAAIDLQRERAILTPTVSPDPQADKIDYFSIGGALTDPTLVASVPNTATAFNLDVTDAAVKVNEVLEVPFIRFQPFPVSDLPRTGTCTVSGTSVLWVSGDTFNLNWQEGSQVIISGSVYTLYGPPASTTRLELVENAGNQTAVAFLIPEATLGGQPLPAMWGPDPITGVLFACGNSKDGGTLFWTNPNDPDSASDANQAQVTSPSEQLLNGFMYDGRSYVESTENLYSCYAQTSINPVTGKPHLTYVPQIVPNGKGLYGMHAFATGDSNWAVTKTGIYQFGGGSLESITDESLYPLFPHRGQTGVLTNGYYPIDFTQPNAMRLFYTKGGLYFVYLDTNGTYQCALYDMTLPIPGWFPLSYTPTARVIYEEEGRTLTTVLMGGSDGRIYQLNLGTSDNGTPINFDFYTPSFDMGDPRLQKLFLDYMLDADPQGVSLTLTPYMDNLVTALAPSSISGVSGRVQTPKNIVQSQLNLYRNISLHVQGSSSLASPVFFEFEPNSVMQPYLALNMTSPNYVTHGFSNYGSIRDGWFVYISTSVITVTILTDAGLTANFTLGSSGGQIRKTYIPLKALKGLLFYYSAVSSQPFAMFTDETVIRVKEWGSDGPYQSFRPFTGQST